MLGSHLENDIYFGLGHHIYLGLGHFLGLGHIPFGVPSKQGHFSWFETFYLILDIYLDPEYIPWSGSHILAGTFFLVWDMLVFHLGKDIYLVWDIFLGLRYIYWPGTYILVGNIFLFLGHFAIPSEQRPLPWSRIF